MTTFQDPPLQSRRAVRQTERDQSPSAVVPTTGPTPTPVAPAAPAEPLTYATQGRTPVPGYDAPNLRVRRTPDPAGQIPADQVPADASAPTQDAGVYRPRDYSPEGRRSASPTWAPAYGGNPADAAPAAAESVVMPSTLDADDVIEHTLTRRELRALRDAHGITAATTGETVYPTPEPEQAPAEALAAAPVPVAQAPVAPAPVAPASVEPGTPLAAPSTRLDSALAEFDQLAAGRPPAVPTDPPAPRGRRAAAKAVDEVAAPVAEAPFAPAPVAAPAGPAQLAPESLNPNLAPPPEPVVIAEIVAPPIALEPTPAPVVHEQIVEATVVEAPAEPSTATPPTGHWSTQAELDDETQFGDAQLARNIGSTSGAITTSALVLPSIPNHDFGPLGSGEIMLTGSISLPDSLSATGAHPAQLDESDLDHLLDPGDSQVHTDSQPVRAIKAVSTHTSSRGVIQTVKPKGTRGLTALIIAATSMAVIVGALFIVLVATGQL